MHTIWLHYGGEAIELGEDADAGALERGINATPRPGWITVTDKEHNTHRLLIHEGVSVRISRTYLPAPAVPVSTSPSIGNTRDVQF